MQMDSRPGIVKFSFSFFGAFANFNSESEGLLNLLNGMSSWLKKAVISLLLVEEL
jgi:hypothetical protein